MRYLTARVLLLAIGALLVVALSQWAVRCARSLSYFLPDGKVSSVRIEPGRAPGFNFEAGRMGLY